MMNKRILYGDDKEENRRSLARALRLRNLEVDLVSSPAELVAKARAEKYGVIVTDLDYTLEGREGYEVLKQIKDLPAVKVLYTGQAGYEFIPEAFENGADWVVLRKKESDLLEVFDEKLNLGGENGK
jgi:CheY-like chemotaxis protein